MDNRYYDSERAHRNRRPEYIEEEVERDNVLGPVHHRANPVDRTVDETEYVTEAGHRFALLDWDLNPSKAPAQQYEDEGDIDDEPAAPAAPVSKPLRGKARPAAKKPVRGKEEEKEPAPEETPSTAR